MPWRSILELPYQVMLFLSFFLSLFGSLHLEMWEHAREGKGEAQRNKLIHMCEITGTFRDHLPLQQRRKQVHNNDTNYTNILFTELLTQGGWVAGMRKGREKYDTNHCNQ